MVFHPPVGARVVVALPTDPDNPPVGTEGTVEVLPSHFPKSAVLDVVCVRWDGQPYPDYYKDAPLGGHRDTSGLALATRQPSVLMSAGPPPAAKKTGNPSICNVCKNPNTGEYAAPANQPDGGYRCRQCKMFKEIFA